MANRLTDTDKWKKPWFRKLNPTHKCFWQYLVDNCNHAGVWDVDFELAEAFIGTPLDIESIKQTFAKQYVELNRGKKWLLRDFISFQYKKGLNPENRVHASVIDILKKEGAMKGLKRPLQGCKDKDKDKDKDKEAGFDELWAKYPKKVGKKAALNHFRATIKTPQDLVSIKIALDNYLASARVAKGYVQNASTFFNQWQDWITYTEPICPKCKGKGKYVNERGYEAVCDCQPKGKENPRL